MSKLNTLANPLIDPPCVNVLGVGIHAIDISTSVEMLEESVRGGRKGYVCVTGVHGIMEAQRHHRFREILSGALLVTPDGMPTVWVGKAQGFHHMGRVFGPDLMLQICRRSVANGFTHFLYGGKDGIAQKLQTKLEQVCPGIRIVGTLTPPFRALLPEERKQLCELIAQLNPDIIWVGLSTPKQELFMAEYLESLSCRLMVGVGAAFDIHAGEIQDAPAWVKSSGLQWLHRLCQEPSRLWKRYLINNTGFLWRIFLQFSGLRRYRLGQKFGTSPLSDSH